MWQWLGHFTFIKFPSHLISYLWGWSRYRVCWRDVVPCSEHAFLALERLHHFSSKAGLLELINLLSPLIKFSHWPCSMMHYTFCALRSLHSDISLVWAGNITRALINISASCWDLHVYILENQCTLTEGGTDHQQAQDVKWVQVGIGSVVQLLKACRALCCAHCAFLRAAHSQQCELYEVCPSVCGCRWKHFNPTEKYLQLQMLCSFSIENPAPDFPQYTVTGHWTAVF